MKHVLVPLEGINALLGVREFEGVGGVGDADEAELLAGGHLGPKRVNVWEELTSS